MMAHCDFAEIGQLVIDDFVHGLSQSLQQYPANLLNHYFAWSAFRWADAPPFAPQVAALLPMMADLSSSQ